MNFEKCAANCGKFAWRNEKYCLTCLKKIAEENKNTNISELPEIKKQREMIQKNAPAERKTFWKLMQKKLKELGDPFTIRPSIANGEYRHWASIYSKGSVDMSTDFLVQKGILRIELYIKENLILYKVLKEHKADIEKLIGTPLIYTDGEKNPNIKWIKKEWTFIPYNYEDYERVIDTALPTMIRFVNILKGFL